LTFGCEKSGKIRTKQRTVKCEAAGNERTLQVINHQAMYMKEITQRVTVTTSAGTIEKI